MLKQTLSARENRECGTLPPDSPSLSCPPTTLSGLRCTAVTPS